jgi:S1-C subfamily serine protease
MSLQGLIRTLAGSGLLRRLLLVAAAAALIVALLAGAIAALVMGGHSAPAPSTTHAVRIDSPAVVRILSVWEGQLICHGCARNGSDVLAPDSGTFETYTSGSGAFISPDGYVLTADHVTEHSTNNPDDVDSLLSYAANDWANRFGSSASFWLQYYQDHGNAVDLKISTASSQVFLSTAYTSQLQNTAQVASYRIQRVVASSPVYKQDTSIVKIEAHDMPYLTLASASSVSIGDTVTSIGFPGDADSVLNGGNFTALLDLTHSDINTVNSLLSSSVQTGQVTATKSMADGTPVYETSGISSQGSSGGPVIDQSGQIIGFVDAGPSDHRLSFLIPSSVVAEYAHEANVTSPAQGNFMGQWTSAIDDYDSTGPCHLSRATGTLQQMRDQYPTFGAAQALLQTAQNNAASNSCPSPVGIGLAAGGIAGLLALIAGAALAYVSLRRQDVPLPVAVRAWYGSAPGAASGYRPIAGPGVPSAPPMQQSWIPPAATSSIPPAMPPSGPYATPPDPYGASSQPQGQYPPGASYPTMPPSMPPSGPGMAPYPPNPATMPPQQPAAPNGSQPTYPQPQPVYGPATAPGAGPPITRVCSQGHAVADPAATACPFCGATVWEIPAQS